MLTNWLGKWFGGWFGASAPSSPGAMSGAATVGIAASAGLTASGVMSGAAALSISSSGSIGVSLPGNNACWGASWGDSWGYAWGLLSIPYTELKPQQRVALRSALEVFYSLEATTQIIAYAAENGVSAVEATKWVTAKEGVVRVDVRAQAKKPPPKAVPQRLIPTARRSSVPKEAFVITSVQSGVSVAKSGSVFVEASELSRVAFAERSQLLATTARKQLL